MMESTTRRDDGRRPVRLLIFDVNGVLYHYDPNRRVEVLGAAIHRSPDAVDEAMFGSGLEDAADSGSIGPDEYLDGLSERLGTPVDRDTWRAALVASTARNKPLHGLLTELRVNGRLDDVRTVTLSNSSMLVREEVESIFPELAELGVEFHVAAELGDAKPAARVYEDLCTHLGVEPSEAAFVDDKRDNVDGARRAGLRAHHFSDTAAFEGFLSELGLVPAD